MPNLQKREATQLIGCPVCPTLSLVAIICFLAVLAKQAHSTVTVIPILGTAHRLWRAMRARLLASGECFALDVDGFRLGGRGSYRAGAPIRERLGGSFALPSMHN